jgi:peptide/nickel transport system ATP-binding protein
VMVMRQGEVVELGTGREIFETPRHAYTKSLIEAIPGRAKEALMTA